MRNLTQTAHSPVQQSEHPTLTASRQPCFLSSPHDERSSIGRSEEMSSPRSCLESIRVPSRSKIRRSMLLCGAKFQNITGADMIDFIMQRRSFLATPLAAWQVSAAAAPAEDRVYAIGDGVRHTPESYARLLATLTAGGKVAVDDYSRGGIVGQLETRMASLLGKEAAVASESFGPMVPPVLSRPSSFGRGSAHQQSGSHTLWPLRAVCHYARADKRDSHLQPSLRPGRALAILFPQRSSSQPRRDACMPS